MCIYIPYIIVRILVICRFLRALKKKNGFSVLISDSSCLMLNIRKLRFRSLQAWCIIKNLPIDVEQNFAGTLRNNHKIFILFL